MTSLSIGVHLGAVNLRGGGLSLTVTIPNNATSPHTFNLLLQDGYVVESLGTYDDTNAASDATLQIVNADGTDSVVTWTGYLLGGTMKFQVPLEKVVPEQTMSYFSGEITFTATGGASGQYADGSYWTTGQITAMTPALDTNATRTTEDLTEYTGTTVHGWRVNPGLSPSGSTLAEKQAVNSGTFEKQAYDSLVIGTNAEYDATLRPALPIASGSVVKAKSRLSGIRDDGRPVLDYAAVCTVVPSAPASGALRPPLARADKTPILNVADIELTKLENFDATGYAIPSYADALSWVTAFHTHENTYNVFHRNIVAPNGAANSDVVYFGDMAERISQILLALHFDAWTDEQKIEIITRLGVWAQDIAARTYEGGIWQDFGGHAHGRLPVLRFCAEIFDSDYLRGACDLTVAISDHAYVLGAPVYGDLTQLAYVTQAWIDLGVPEQDAGGDSVPAWTQTQLGWPGWAGSASRRLTTNTLYNILGHVSERPEVSSPPAYQDAPYAHIVAKSLGAARLALALIGENIIPQVWRDYADRYMGWWINDATDARFTLPQPNINSRPSGINSPPAWVAQAWNVNAGGRTMFWPSDYPAPTLSAATETDITDISATIGVTTDQATNRLYAVVTTSATAPSAAQVKAGQDHAGALAVWSGSQVLTALGAKTFSATGLMAETTYYTHFVHENAWAKTSSVVSGDFTTTAAFTFSARSVSLDGSSRLDQVGLNIAGSSEGTFSAWIYHDGTWNSPVGGRIFRASVSATVAFEIFVASSGRVQVLLNGTTNYVPPTSTFTGSRWHHLAISYKAGASGWYQFAVDGTVITTAAQDLTAATLGIDGTITAVIAGSNGSTNWPGDLGHVYFNPTVAIDLSDAGNMAKFISGGSPVNLGEFGEIPTGAAPAFYFDGDGAAWNNLGTAGAFNVVGTITAGTTPVLP